MRLVIESESINRSHIEFRDFGPNSRAALGTKLVVLVPTRITGHSVGCRCALDQSDAAIQVDEVGGLKLGATDVLAVRAVAERRDVRNGCCFKTDTPAQTAAG